MKKIVLLTVMSFFALSCESGNDFGLREIRLKNKIGPEYRSKGEIDSTRWTAQTGIQFKHNNGWTTGVTYRHRWNNGDTDDGIWFEFSIPLYTRR